MFAALYNVAGYIGKFQVGYHACGGVIDAKVVTIFVITMCELRCMSCSITLYIQITL